MRLGQAEVRRAATFARLALDDERVVALTAELAPVAALLAPLRQVRPEPAGGAVGVGAGGMPLRVDAGPPYAFARGLGELAPLVRAGYVTVPRLASDVPGVPGSVGEPTRLDPVGDDALSAELELGA